MTEKKTFTLSGFELRDGISKPQGNSGYVNVPHKWVGKRVSVILLDSVDEEK